MKRLVSLVVLAVLGAATAAQAQYVVESVDAWRPAYNGYGSTLSSPLVRVEQPVYESTGRIVYSNPVEQVATRYVSRGGSYDQELSREVRLTQRQQPQVFPGPGEEDDSDVFERRTERIPTHQVDEALPPPPGYHHHHEDEAECCRCKKIILTCEFPCGNKGSFVLDCTEGGVATWRAKDGCIGGACLEFIKIDHCGYAWYQEANSDIRWAFQLEHMVKDSNWHRVFIHRRRHALSPQWKLFCHAWREENCSYGHGHHDHGHGHCHGGHCPY